MKGLFAKVRISYPSSPVALHLVTVALNADPQMGRDQLCPATAHCCPGPLLSGSVGFRDEWAAQLATALRRCQCVGQMASDVTPSVMAAIMGSEMQFFSSF